jgi:aspartate/methionine/tyrosine aminotransferase
MTRIAVAHKAINLEQGFPDFGCPPELKTAAKQAIDADINQYAITWGAQGFREAIAQKFERTYGMAIDPNRQICVTCGSTEAMIAAILAIVDPGDEVVVFEPFYENYGPDAILSGAIPRYVTLREPGSGGLTQRSGSPPGGQDWTFDEAELTAAFNERTRGIIINTPNNPTGKVFTRAELSFIAALCQKWNVVAFTDEIYEHMTYDGHVHVPPLTIPGMEDRTVTINAMSKTYSVTGWRVGWTVASPELTDGIRKVHDFLTVGAAAPLQEAGVVAMNFPESYYKTLQEEYLERRDLMIGILEKTGLRVYKPFGAYYIMTDFAEMGWDGDDVEVAKRLTKDPGIATVPGSSFYSRPELGSTKLRFAFCKKLDTLRAAAERLSKI